MHKTRPGHTLGLVTPGLFHPNSNPNPTLLHPAVPCPSRHPPHSPICFQTTGPSPRLSRAVFTPSPSSLDVRGHRSSLSKLRGPSGLTGRRSSSVTHPPSPYMKLATSRDCSTVTVVTLAGPSRRPAHPHPWAIRLVSSVSHSPQRPQKAASALLSHPALSFPLTFLLWSENRSPHKAPPASRQTHDLPVSTVCSGSASCCPTAVIPPPGGPHTRGHSRMANPVPAFSGAPAH